jgi:mycothiol S-conjugate amidase
MTALSRDGEQLRLMAVHAHPDDESSKGAATMAKYVAESVDVLVVTCTGGEAGSILNPAMDRPEIRDNISEVRRREMERAIELLGVRQQWLGYVDSGLPEAPEGADLPPLEPDCFAMQPLEVVAGTLVEVVRRERPHVIVTYDENGGYPHPDHIMCHRVSVEAFEAAGEGRRYPEAGEPWRPLKLYYHMTFSKSRVQALHEACVARGIESPYAERLQHWSERPEDAARVTTKVPCGDFFKVRDAALIAHATQVDPLGFWFKVPLEIHQEVWPTEDYQLVQSHVASGIPEHDLFAGIRAAD